MGISPWINAKYRKKITWINTLENYALIAGIGTLSTLDGNACGGFFNAFETSTINPHKIIAVPKREYESGVLLSRTISYRKAKIICVYPNSPIFPASAYCKPVARHIWAQVPARPDITKLKTSGPVIAFEPWNIKVIGKTREVIIPK